MDAGIQYSQEERMLKTLLEAVLLEDSGDPTHFPPER